MAYLVVGRGAKVMRRSLASLAVADCFVRGLERVGSGSRILQVRGYLRRGERDQQAIPF